MTDIRCLLIHAAKPTAITTPHGPAPAIQFTLKSGDEIAAVMSGEGMGLLAKEIARFLEEFPALAATTTAKQQ